MNKISVSDTTGLKKIKVAGIKSFCKKVLAVRNVDNWEVSILFCLDEEIAVLNKTYRGKEGPTDVLSFCQCDGDQFPVHGMKEAGDIVISIPALHRNCGDFDEMPNEELKRLLVHGILHLEGHDHKTNKASEPMLKLQEEILRETGKELLI